MKKLLSLTLIMSIILPFSACSSAPSVDEILPRLRELVEESYQINEIFFGKGLPTYPRVEKRTDKPFSYDSTNDIYYLMFEDEKLGDMCMYYDKESSGYRFLRILPDDGNDVNGDLVYTDEEGRRYFRVDYTEPEVEYVYTDDDAPDYNVVRVDCGFASIDDLKNAAKKVYTADFLEQIFQGAFDGVAYAEEGYSGVRSARFIEQDMLLRQYAELDERMTARRIYDFDTVKIIRPSNQTRINLRVDTHLEGESKILNVRLTLIKAEDGKWYLDTPTY